MIGWGSETSLEEVVEELLLHADPEREVYPKLIKIRDAVRRGTFLGPSARAFLDRLYTQLHENIECRGLTAKGLCTLIPKKGNCDCAARFRRCVAYEPVRPLRRNARVV